MALLHPVIRVVNSPSAVPTAINDLTSSYDITSTEFIQLEITPFGANQFLITVVYAGPFQYLRSVATSLLSKITQAISKAPRFVAEGLVTVFSKLPNKVRQTMLGCEVIDFGRAIGTVRANTPSVGVLTSIDYNHVIA